MLKKDIIIVGVTDKIQQNAMRGNYGMTANSVINRYSWLTKMKQLWIYPSYEN